MKRLRFDYRHIICIAITLGFVALGVFKFFGAVGRLIESGRDFGLSVGYLFAEMFGIPHNITPTVNDFPKYPFLIFRAALPFPLCRQSLFPTIGKVLRKNGRRIGKLGQAKSIFIVIFFFWSILFFTCRNSYCLPFLSSFFCMLFFVNF